MISRPFKAILKVLSHLYYNFGLDRLLSPKKYDFFNIITNGQIRSSNQRSCFADHNGTKFFKIEQKMYFLYTFICIC